MVYGLLPFSAQARDDPHLSDIGLEIVGRFSALTSTSGGDALGQRQDGADHPPVLTALDQVERLLIVEIRIGAADPEMRRVFAQHAAQDIDHGPEFEKTFLGRPAG